MDDDELDALAAAEYESERRVGWDPAWVNAHPTVRAKYEERILQQEFAGEA